MYIIDGRNQQLLIIDAAGDIKKLYGLNSKEFAQPEGITFTPSGELFIASKGIRDESGMLFQVRINK